MSDDPPIDEIRRVRSQISAEHDHDPLKLVQHYREMQKDYADRVISGPDLLLDQEKKKSSDNAA